MEKAVLLKRYERLMQEGEDIRNLRGFEVFTSNGELVKELKNSQENYIEAIEAKERRLNKRYGNLLAKLEELNLQEEKALSNLLDKRIIDAEERIEKTELELTDEEEELEIEKKIPSANISYLEAEVKRLKEQKIRQEKEAQEYKTRKSKAKEIMDRIKNIEKEMENEKLDPIARYSLENQRENLIEEKSKLYEPEKSALQYTSGTRNREQEMKNIKAMLGVQYRISRNETDNLKRVLHFGQRAQKLQNQMIEYIQESLKENLEQANKNVQNRYRQEIQERTNSFITEKMKANNHLEVIKNRYEKDRITNSKQYEKKIENNNKIIEAKKKELESTTTALKALGENGKASLIKSMKSRLKELSRDIRSLESANENERINLENQEKAHKKNIEDYEKQIAEMQQQYEKYIGEVYSNMQNDLKSDYETVSNSVLKKNNDIFKMLKGIDIDYSFEEKSVGLVNSFKQNANIDPNFVLETLNKFLKETSNKTITGEKEKAIIEELSKNFSLNREEEEARKRQEEEAERKRQEEEAERKRQEKEAERKRQEEEAERKRQEEEAERKRQEEEAERKRQEEAEREIKRKGIKDINKAYRDVEFSSKLNIQDDFKLNLPTKLEITNKVVGHIKEVASEFAESTVPFVAGLVKNLKHIFMPNKQIIIKDEYDEDGKKVGDGYIETDDNGEIEVMKKQDAKTVERIYTSDMGERVTTEFAVAPYSMIEAMYGYNIRLIEDLSKKLLAQGVLETLKSSKIFLARKEVAIQEEKDVLYTTTINLYESEEAFKEGKLPKFISSVGTNGVAYMLRGDTYLTFDSDNRIIIIGQNVQNYIIEPSEEEIEIMQRDYELDDCFKKISYEIDKKIKEKEDKLLENNGSQQPKSENKTSISERFGMFIGNFFNNRGESTEDQNETPSESNREVEEDKSKKNNINGKNPGETDIHEEMIARDEFFEQAARLIIEKQKASIGSLQSAFKIRFYRAAEIMNQLQEYGIVGEEDGTKPRKILVTMEELENIINSLNLEENRTDNSDRIDKQKKKRNPMRDELQANIEGANSAHIEPGKLTKDEISALGVEEVVGDVSVSGHYKKMPFYGWKNLFFNQEGIVTPEIEILINEGKFYDVLEEDGMKRTKVINDKLSKQTEIIIYEGNTEVSIGTPSEFGDTYEIVSDKKIREMLGKTLENGFNEEELFMVKVIERGDESTIEIENIYENEEACINGEKPIVTSRHEEYVDKENNERRGYKRYVCVRDSDKESYLDMADGSSDRYDFKEIIEFGLFFEIPEQVLEIMKRGYEPEQWIKEVCNAIKAKEEQQKQNQNQSEQGSN